MGLGEGEEGGGWWVQANFGQFSIGGGEGGTEGAGGGGQATSRNEKENPWYKACYYSHTHICTLYKLVTGKLFTNPIALQPTMFQTGIQLQICTFFRK